MGKRKSRKPKPASKKKIKLETVFNCPFCNFYESVTFEFDKNNYFASATCYVCGASYSTKTNALTEPIDIYHEWIDECEKVNNRVN